MEITLFTCAQSAVIDRQTSGLSIFNIYEELTAPVFPIAVQTFTVIMLVTRHGDDLENPNDVRFRIHLDQQLLMDAPIVPNFQGRRGVKIITNVGGMLIPRPGNMLVTVHQGENKLAEWPILVKQIGGAKIEVESAPLQ
jgi:hypothetical protein